MKFFLDTANLADIREAVELGVLDGVTTNPSLMAKEGVRGVDSVLGHYRHICELVDGDVSPKSSPPTTTASCARARCWPSCTPTSW